MDPTSVLNESQKRCLTATLRVTEERLILLRNRLAGESTRQTLVRVDNDVIAGERAFVIQRIDDAIGLISEIRDRLSLEPAPQSLRRLVIATVSLMLVDLAELKADKLRAYGEPDHDLSTTADPTTVDPLIDTMAAALERVVTCLQRHS